MWFVFVVDDDGEIQINDTPFNAYQIAELLSGLAGLRFLLRPA